MLNKIIVGFRKSENFLAYLSLFLLAFLPFAEVIIRKFFHSGIEGLYDYTHHLVLFVTFVGGMITSRDGKHLSLSLNINIKEPYSSRVKIVVAIASSAITTALAWTSLSFTYTAFDSTQKIGFIPLRLISLIMFVGFLVMATRVLPEQLKKGNRFYVVLSGFLAGTILALGQISNFFQAVLSESPEFLNTISGFSQSLGESLSFPIILTLLILAVFGLPIYVIIGGIGYLLFAGAGEPLEIISNEAYTMLISASIPAIPLFTLTGFILSESKAGERLVKLFRSLFSWIPGGLAVMAILVSGFFTTFTGASGVTILALGALLSYVLVKGKYKKDFSVGLLTASGSIGLLFPPSLPIIIYGVTAQISIKDMFVGGIVPGIVMITAMAAYSIYYAKKNKVEKEPFDVREAFSAFKESIWEVLLPFIILASYFGGLTTLVESAGIAVIYSLVVEVIIKRDLKLKDLSNVVLKSIPIIGGVLIILACAKGLSYFIVDAEIPMKLTEWVKVNISSKYVFLLMLNLALLVTGMFMDIFSAIMVVVPLILPLGEIFGIHPVHLGIIFLANMELGYLTPPIGLNLFLSSYRFEEPVGKIYKYVIPFFIIQIIAVLLITYLPFISTFLLG
ncbi:MAG: TRAP transporter large permease subunit [Acidobacteriota bacterium]